MKKFGLWIAVAIVAAVLAGCNGTGSQGKGLLSSSGRSGEVLIVCDNHLWKGALGDSLQAILMQSVLGLPQDEPMFMLSHIEEQRFEKAYRKQRNIIVFTIEPSLEKAKVMVHYNTWAQPQLLVRIQAKDEQNAIETLSLYQKIIIDSLIHFEMKRFQRAQQSKQDYHLSTEIEKRFHLSVVIPEGFIFAVKDSAFVWLRKDTKEWTQNLMMYIQDYTDTNQFNNSYIVAYRNQQTRNYVFGAADSSYMLVDEQYIPSMSEYMELKEGYAIRTIGLWTMARDFMGGAFVSISLLDKKNNRIVTLDGFLYAPSDTKRDLLRQLEAILLSAKFTQ
jgi:hypothetical protein